MRKLQSTTIGALGLTLLLAGASPARSASFSIDWLDMSATPDGATFASGSVYSLPGYGDVRIDYTSALPAAPQDWARSMTAEAQNGSLSSGADTYAWTSFDAMTGVNGFGGTPTAVYTITFTFLSGPVPAQQLALASFGLGRNDQSEPGDPKTFVQLFQPGTSLGDWELGGETAPTLFSPIAGGFQLENSVPEPGTGYFNTDLHVARIDAAVSSLVLNMTHIDEDGIAFSVGLVSPAPEPATALLLGIGVASLLAVGRRFSPSH